MSPLPDAVSAATERLAAAGVPSPRHDAEQLAAHALGVPRAGLWRCGDAPAAYWDLVARRERREPLQHITGRAPFRHLELAVGPGVFVPRPETEVVVGHAIEVTRREGWSRPLVVDLYAGSAAIAISVATEVPGSRVYAVEVDPRALRWARRNAAGSGVEVVAGDVDGCLAELDGEVDLVVANPPYIPLDGVVRDPEVRDHDPAIALWAGADGLDAVRVVEHTARRLLRPGGLAVVEHADLQGESAPAVFRHGSDWVDVADHRDLAGRDRFCTARRGPTVGVAR